MKQYHIPIWLLLSVSIALYPGVTLYLFAALGDKLPPNTLFWAGLGVTLLLLSLLRSHWQSSRWPVTHWSSHSRQGLFLLCLLAATLIIIPRLPMVYHLPRGGKYLYVWSKIHDDNWRVALIASARNFGFPLHHPWVPGDNAIPHYPYFYILGGALSSTLKLSPIWSYVFLGMLTAVLYVINLFVLGNYLVGPAGGMYCAGVGLLVGGFDAVVTAILTLRGIHVGTVAWWYPHVFKSHSPFGSVGRPFATSLPYGTLLWAPHHGMALVLFISLLIIVTSAVHPAKKLTIGSVLLQGIIGYSAYVGMGTILVLLVGAAVTWWKERRLAPEGAIVAGGLLLSLLPILYMLPKANSGMPSVIPVIYTLKGSHAFPIVLNILLTYSLGFLINYGPGVLIAFVAVVAIRTRGRWNATWRLIAIAWLVTGIQIGFLASTVSPGNAYAIRVSGIAWIVQALLVAWWLVHIQPRSTVFRTLIIMGLCIGITSTAMELWWRLPTPPMPKLSRNTVALLDTLPKIVPEQAVVVADPIWVAEWIAMYSGRQSVADVFPTATSSTDKMRFADDWRQLLLSELSTPAIRQDAKRGAARGNRDAVFVVLGLKAKRWKEFNDNATVELGRFPYLTLVYHNPEWAVYRIGDGE